VKCLRNSILLAVLTPLAVCPLAFRRSEWHCFPQRSDTIVTSWNYIDVESLGVEAVVSFTTYKAEIDIVKAVQLEMFVISASQTTHLRRERGE
jgi:hypothetical protein